MELHVLLAGVEFGPYSDDKARELLGEGFLSASDPAKRLNETDWIPLSDVLGTQSESPGKPAATASAPLAFAPFFAESLEENEPSATENIAEPSELETPPELETESEPEPHEEEPAAEPEEAIPVAEEKEEPKILPPPVFFAETKRVRPPTISLPEIRPPTQPIPAPQEIKTSFMKALAATRSMAATTKTTGAAPPLEVTVPARPTAELSPLSEISIPPRATDIKPPPLEAPAPPRAADPEPPPIAAPPRLADPEPPVAKVSAPSHPAPAAPSLQVSVPARGKKPTMTGSLMARDALHAARDRSGILPPMRQTLGRMTAPVPEFEPEPPPPRKRTPLVLGERDEPTPAPQPAARKAIRLTGRITLPGSAPMLDKLVSPTPTPNTGAGLVARLSKADMEPAAEVKSAPLQLRERKDPNLLKPQGRKAIRLTGPISLPGRTTQPTPPAVPITEDTEPDEEISAPPESIAPPPETETPERETPPPLPIIPPIEAKAPVEEAPPEPAPGATAPPAEAQSHGPALERTAELAAAAALATELIEKANEAGEPDLTSSGTLTGSGHLLSTGELAEKRSLKVTGALKHALPPRQPIQLSSPSGDSARLPHPGEERAAGVTLPVLDSDKLPAPPVAEEDLPNRPPTGKIAVSEMPTEGVKIRRRITSKVPLPEKSSEALAYESPPRHLPPPLPQKSEEPPALAEAAESLAAAPVLESAAEIAPAPADESPVAPVIEETPAPFAEMAVAEQIAAPPAETTEEAATPAPVVARPEQVRLRRPVKLELSSRAKIQDSGRLTLEAFSKMASLELPKTTPAPVAPAGAAPMTTEPESETPAEVPSAMPLGPGPEATPDLSASGLEEITPGTWRAYRPKKKGDRSLVWILYVTIALGFIAGVIIIYRLREEAALNAEAAETANPAQPSTSSDTTPPSAPPPSASPPAPSSAPASATPPAAATPPPTATPPPSTPPATSAAPAPVTPAPTTTPATTAVGPATTPPTASTPPATSPQDDIARQAGAFVSDGILKYQRSDYDGAIAAYNQAIDLDPKLAEAFFNRGIAKAAHDDLDGAVADYSQALQVDPTLGAAYYYRGLARHSKAELDGAVADYNQAVQLDPKNALAYFNRGLIRMQKDDVDGSIVDSTRALELDPHLIQAYYDRGLGRLAKGAVDGALMDMKTFCQLAPQDGYTDYARLYIWLIQTQQGQMAEANQELTTAMNSGWNGTPDSMVTRIGEYLLGQIGENDLIRASASAIPVKDQGQRCEVWYFIGMRKLEAGDKDAAIAALQKCVATQKVDYCEYILAQEALKGLGGTAAAVPRAQAVSLPDPGTMAPPSAPAPQ